MLSSIYLSLATAIDNSKCSASGASSSSATLITSVLQQLPQAVQSIAALTVSFSRWAITSSPCSARACTERRNSSFSPCFSSAFAAINSRSVIYCSGWLKAANVGKYYLIRDDSSRAFVSCPLACLLPRLQVTDRLNNCVAYLYFDANW